MNDRLRDALDKLAPDVSETGVWQELQERVSTRRRHTRIIQGTLGVVAVLAIGIGASGLLRGDGPTEFVEQATTTTVPTSTTTTATMPGTTTSFVPESVAIDPNQFLGESIWGVYLYVGDPATAESDRIMAGFAQDPGAWGIPRREPVRCDDGMPIEARPDEEAVAFYYAEESTARLYAEHLIPAPLAVWEIERTCNPSITAIDVTTATGPVWAAYFFVGSDVGLQEAQNARVALGRQGISRNNGLLVEADVTCDIGAGTLLDVRGKGQFIAVYFASEAAAIDFSATTSIPPLAIAEVEHICSPDSRLSPWRPSVSSAVQGPPNPYYVVEDTVTVHGQLGPGETVFLQGSAPAILEGDHFEGQVPLTPGLNEIEVRFVKLGDEVTIETLQITHLPNAVRQFAFIEEFAGEMIVDYADLLTGEEANEAAREAGEIGEGETVPNDFFISNINPAARGLALAEDAVIYVLGFDEEGAIKPVLVDRSDFETMFEGNFDPADWYGGDPRQLPYWLIIEGETVVQVEQQYLP